MSILAAKKPEFAQTVEVCAQTVREGGPFVIAGGGTSRFGLAQGEALRAPKDAWDYDPSALTVTVAAGVSVATIESVLAEERQRLSFEVPDMRGLLGRSGEPTVGGMVAGNLSGPRRVGVGACRDFCLGVGFVDGRGQVVKNGGRVMKNVTGLDLVKLMAGAQGTLGLLTEVSLKVAPIPERMATLVLKGLSETQAVTAMSAALGSPFDVMGAAHIRATGETLLRLEGFESSVRYRMGELRGVLRAFGKGEEIWDDADGEALWRAVRDVERFHDAQGDVWRVAVKPSEAPALVEAVGPLDAIYDWGGNRLWFLTEAGTDVRAKMGAGHATLIRTSDETKRALGVFQPEAAAVARLSAGLRAKFDPEGKFNAGMMG